MYRAELRFREDLVNEHKAEGRFRDALYEGMSELPFYYQKEYMRYHFSEGNRDRYRYQKRSTKWENTKRRRRRGNVDLVNTGLAKQEALRSSNLVVKGIKTGKRVTGTYKMPKYFYKYRKDYKQPDKAAEMTTVRIDESQDMAKVLDRYLEAKLNNRG